MTKLDELLRAPDNKERLKVLLEYARSLKVNTLKAKNEAGEYSENDLIILLYDAEKSRVSNRYQNLGLIVGIAFVLVMIFAGIFLMTVMLKN